MVKLTNDFVIKSVHKLKSSKSSDTTEEKVLNNLTHLCLNDKCIDKIGDISELKNVSVLYLHNNNLNKIDNLETSTCLTHIYLQNNAIKKIENLNHLKKLKKLYLAKNHISVVEGLNYNKALEELHIEDQILTPDQSMSFDPLTLTNIAGSLRVLNITGNKLSSLIDLGVLRAIEKLDASNNLLTDISDVCETVKNWKHIKEMDLRMNKVTCQQKYRDKIILSTNKLEMLDGKEIKDMTRRFLLRFEMFKEERKCTLEKQKSKQTPFSPEITSLSHHLPPSIRDSISNNKEMLPKTTNLILSLSSFVKKPAQKSEDSLYPTKGFFPRPFRRLSNVGNTTGLRQKSNLQNSTIPLNIGDI